MTSRMYRPELIEVLVARGIQVFALLCGRGLLRREDRECDACNWQRHIGVHRLFVKKLRSRNPSIITE